MRNPGSAWLPSAMNPESAPVPSPAAPVSAVRTPSAERYFAMDSVRSVAMLLGVLYHALLFGGGMMGGFGGGPKSAAIHVMDWIHSFRMPLFFLISGFFCHLMVGRYGTKAYVLKRWWRLGIPFVLTLFVLAGIKTVFPQQGFGGPGPRPPGGEGRPGGPGWRHWVTAIASAMRDSSPPEATLAKGRGVLPACPATRNSADSSP